MAGNEIYICLENGDVFKGYSFGADGEVIGELFLGEYVPLGVTGRRRRESEHRDQDERHNDEYHHP